MPTASELIEPVDPQHDDFFDIVASSNCMKQPVYIYYLNRSLDASLAEIMAPLGILQFPLGRDCGVVKMDSAERFVLSGILGLKELSITLRTQARTDTRAGFETLLAEYCRIRQRAAD
jgi:hypothetical protein